MVRKSWFAILFFALIVVGCSPAEEPAETPDITMVSIPTGTFQMGSATGPYEQQPVHTVLLSAFQMSVTEITNAQYAEYLNTALAAGEIRVQITATYNNIYGPHPAGPKYLVFSLSSDSNNRCWISYDGSSFSVETGKENWPVVNVTWYGAKAFAVKYGLDLPTEAEWEYSARGGQQYEYGTDYGTISITKANYDGNVGYPTDTASYPANPFGLYDMAGNVSEYCNDWYGSYSSENATDPQGPTWEMITGAGFAPRWVVRGGSWASRADHCLSAFRSDNSMGWHLTRGFRVVLR